MNTKPVSAKVLDAAIAWKLSLDGGDGTADERIDFMRWHAASEEHARAWQQLGMLDQRVSAAAARHAKPWCNREQVCASGWAGSVAAWLVCCWWAHC